jgi:hypothetical protein
MMKIRYGFVSNSSTSSFLCGVCGADAAGYDMCLSEAEMFQCEHGHEFCEEHVLRSDEFWDACELGSETRWSKVEDHELTSEDRWKRCGLTESEQRYALPAMFCPVCNLDVISDSDLLRYILQDLEYSCNAREQVAERIRHSFRSFKELNDWLNNKNEIQSGS